jgi:hypothetical protein
MRGDLLLVFLLGLATGVAQTDKKTATEPAAGAARTQKKEAVSKQKRAASAKMESPQGATSEATTKTLSEQTDLAQVKTEAEQKAAQTAKDTKLTSVPGGQALGMSILGSEETPTSLVIVPWKSSEVGRATGISPMLDDSRKPVDKEVFMRELSYYEIRSEKKP